MSPRYTEAVEALQSAILVAERITRDCQDPAVNGQAIDTMLAIFDRQMESLRRAVWVTAAEHVYVPSPRP